MSAAEQWQHTPDEVQQQESNIVNGLNNVGPAESEGFLRQLKLLQSCSMITLCTRWHGQDVSRMPRCQSGACRIGESGLISFDDAMQGHCLQHDCFKSVEKHESV